MLVQILNPGWGSSGFYGQSVIREAERGRVFAKGTQCFLDHSTETEDHERPERSVRDLAAVFTEDARWDEGRNALVAEIQTFAPYREMLTDPAFCESIGLSIRASGIAEHGMAEGRSGLIVKEITEAQSVDFVTKAGRGGKVLALLESARTKLAESPTEQIRQALERAVRAAYGVGEHRYAWIRDFDPERTVVWFDTDAAGDSAQAGTWEQAYATNGVDVALLGPRRQVTAVTVYRPISDVTDTAAAFDESAGPEARSSTTADVTDGAPPTGSTTPTTTEEVSAVADTSTAGTAPVVDTAAIQIEAREAATARDKAVSERDAALKEAADIRAERDAARAELAKFRAVESARPLVAAQLAESGLPAAAQAKVTAGVTTRVPLTESGQLDQNSLRALVEAEITAEKTYVAQLAEANGAGTVTGFGQQPQTAAQPSANPWVTAPVEPNQQLIESYQRRGLSAEAARLAAVGRAV